MDVVPAINHFLTTLLKMVGNSGTSLKGIVWVVEKTLARTR
jgi:hypothetical protein